MQDTIRELHALTQPSAKPKKKKRVAFAAGSTPARERRARAVRAAAPASRPGASERVCLLELSTGHVVAERCDAAAAAAASTAVPARRGASAAAGRPPAPRAQPSAAARAARFGKTQLVRPRA